MCGIAGIVDCKKTNLTGVIEKMRDTLSYRGPDGCGLYVEAASGIALGHRRLTILDLSSAGAQPMQDTKKQVVIVYNGEVYNYLELRRELVTKGYTFLSGTDTEVVLNAFLEWGTDCLKRFNGMFAFAIWDKRTSELFIARDRLGIKPLYYYLNNTSFVFASEVKAVLKGIGKIPKLNNHLIDLYMSFGYIPGDSTLHNGVKRLMPGHFLLYKEGNITIQKYWDLSFEKSHDRGLNYYVDKAKFLLNDSIELRLRSDVPLGIFLSGGLDSSAVVALLASRVQEPLKTYSVAYDFGKEYNETKYSRKIAKLFNTDHHEYILTPSEFVNFIPEYVYYMDEPVTEAAAISLYHIARLARKDVTVVLSGEGSDEIFAGYDFYFYNCIIEKIRQLFGGRGTKALSQFVNCLPGLPKLKKYCHLSTTPLAERYRGISSYEDKVKRNLYTDDFFLVVHSHKFDLSSYQRSLFNKTSDADPLSRMLYFDTKTWLVDDLLIKADRMSMAASLELRVPFLDYRLVEFAAKMPSNYKLRGRTTKYILKKMMADLLPNEIINRKKMGFPTPLKLMFQRELYEYARDLLISPQAKIKDFFVLSTIKNILTEHKRGMADHHRIIWQLVVLENWLQTNTARS